jgi:hypothetical protein
MFQRMIAPPSSEEFRPRSSSARRVGLLVCKDKDAEILQNIGDCAWNHIPEDLHIHILAVQCQQLVYYYIGMG